jgi:hypothetical protein
MKPVAFALVAWAFPTGAIPIAERLDVFALGTDSSMYHNYTVDGTNWQGWNGLGDTFRSF